MKSKWESQANDIALKIANESCRAINERTPASFDGMPYARQAVLEFLVKELEARI